MYFIEISIYIHRSKTLHLAMCALKLPQPLSHAIARQLLCRLTGHAGATGG